LTPLAKDETPRHREALRTSLFQSAAALLTVAGAIIVTFSWPICCRYWLEF